MTLHEDKDETIRVLERALEEKARRIEELEGRQPADEKRDQINLSLTLDGVTFELGDRSYAVSMARAIADGDDEMLLRYGSMLQLSDVSRKLSAVVAGTKATTSALGAVVTKLDLVASSISTLVHQLRHPDPKQAHQVSLDFVRQQIVGLETMGLKLTPEMRQALEQAGLGAAT